jgi:hypothetical protein
MSAMSQAVRLARLLDAKRTYDESAAAINELAASDVISSAQAAQVLRACMCTSDVWQVWQGFH